MNVFGKFHANVEVEVKKKQKRLKSNTITLDIVKPRNETLHAARHAAKAGRQSEKVSFTRARDKQKVYREINEI